MIIHNFSCSRTADPRKKIQCEEYFIEPKSNIQTRRSYLTVDVERNRTYDASTLKHSSI